MKKILYVFLLCVFSNDINSQNFSGVLDVIYRKIDTKNNEILDLNNKYRIPHKYEMLFNKIYLDSNFTVNDILNSFGCKIADLEKEKIRLNNENLWLKENLILKDKNSSAYSNQIDSLKTEANIYSLQLNSKNTLIDSLNKEIVALLNINNNLNKQKEESIKPFENTAEVKTSIFKRLFTTDKTDKIIPDSSTNPKKIKILYVIINAPQIPMDTTVLRSRLYMNGELYDKISNVFYDKNKGAVMCKIETNNLKKRAGLLWENEFKFKKEEDYKVDVSYYVDAGNQIVLGKLIKFFKKS